MPAEHDRDPSQSPWTVRPTQPFGGDALAAVAVWLAAIIVSGVLVWILADVFIRGSTTAFSVEFLFLRITELLLCHIADSTEETFRMVGSD